MASGEPLEVAVTWQSMVLVVAAHTVDSDHLQIALKERARHGAVTFELLVPAGAGERERLQRHLDAALTRLREASVEVVGALGTDTDPAVCVKEAWDPSVYDEVIVSTLPTGVSRWLQIDLPHRVARMTDAPVTHVIAA